VITATVQTASVSVKPFCTRALATTKKSVLRSNRRDLDPMSAEDSMSTRTSDDAADAPLSSSSSFVRLVLITLLIALLLRWLILRILQLYRKVQLIDRIPGPRSFNPILGNLPFEVLKYVGSDIEASRDMYTALLQAVRGYTEVYREQRIYRLWLGWEPLVILWKPETVEQILSHNFLLDKSSQYSLLHSWLGTGLLTSAGHKWRTRRKMLVPAFHFKILYDFVPVFNEQGWVFVDCLRDLARAGQPFDIVPVVTACTLDIICGSFFLLSLFWTNVISTRN
jgi:hypothetical protein